MNHTWADNELSISQRSIGPRILLVRFGGQLTSESACALAKWVGKVCRGPARAIHADVSRVDYVDDAGAWALALAFQCVRFHGHPVKIYNAPLPLRHVLDIVCIDRAGAQRPTDEPPSASRCDRTEHENLAGRTPARGWLAMDLLMCNEDPQLSSMFEIFDQLSSSQGPPANAQLSPRRLAGG